MALGKGGGERRLLYFTAGSSSSSMSMADHWLSYLKWGHLVADLDSGALALTKEASANSLAVCLPEF